MRALIPCLALAVTACATPSGQRQNAPVVSETSTHRPEQVIACIAAAWSEMTPYRFNTIPGDGRTTLTLSADFGTEATVDVFNDGRVVAYKRGTPLGANARGPIRAVRDCI